MVNSDDLEEILGPRPFKSAELRNIDKFREGFVKQGPSEGVENPKPAPTPTNGPGLPGILDVPAAG